MNLYINTRMHSSRMRAARSFTVSRSIQLGGGGNLWRYCHLIKYMAENFVITPVVVPKCFIKHMCFIVLYFHGHAFFSLEIAKKCFFVLYFLKNVLYFCKLFKWVEFLF